MPDDASAARAYRGANRDLSLPSGRACQQQTGNISASNQQHENDCARQNEKRETDLAADGHPQRNHIHAFGLVHDVRVGCTELIGDDRQLGLS